MTELKKVYQYDEITLEFRNINFAQLDPAGSGDYLLPNNTTFKEPLECAEGELTFHYKDQWHNILKTKICEPGIYYHKKDGSECLVDYKNEKCHPYFLDKELITDIKPPALEEGELIYFENNQWIYKEISNITLQNIRISKINKLDDICREFIKKVNLFYFTEDEWIRKTQNHQEIIEFFNYQTKTKNIQKVVEQIKKDTDKNINTSYDKNKSFSEQLKEVEMSKCDPSVNIIEYLDAFIVKERKFMLTERFHVSSELIMKMSYNDIINLDLEKEFNFEPNLNKKILNFMKIKEKDIDFNLQDIPYSLIESINISKIGKDFILCLKEAIEYVKIRNIKEKDLEDLEVDEKIKQLIIDYYEIF